MITLIRNKFKNTSPSTLWIALLLSFVVVLILCDLYASNLLLNPAIQNSVCQTSSVLCNRLINGFLLGFPYLFLVPGFCLTIQLTRCGNKLSKVFAWVFLIGQVLFLPFFWMLLLTMALGIGLAQNREASF